MAVLSTNSQVNTAGNPTATNTAALSMVTTLFFVWGFLTSLNDILIPHLKSIFDLNFAQAMLVQSAFFASYFVFATPSGKLVEIIGYKKTMVTGLLVMALGAVLFIPAAAAPSYPLFLGALIVLAAGITTLQVSANPYVSVLGPERTASSRLNLAQAFNSLGTTLAPFFGSILILSAAPKTMEQVRAMSATALRIYRVHEASSVKMPYLYIALALVLLGLSVAIFKLPRIEQTQDFRPGAGHSGDSIWKYKHTVLGAIGIFVYVGAEVSIGSFLVNYFTQPDTGGLTVQVAAKLVSLYWMGAMIGRFIGSAILTLIRPGKLLGIVAVLATLLVLTSMLTYGHVAVWSILLVGLCNSIMFPTIFTLGIAELGPLTGKGSGLLVAAIVGGAIIPVAEGVLADHIGIHHAFILPILCYLFIVYYGYRGSKPTRTA
ncbi:sugar MFS transporter [Granulicella arctica]|uniref:FHS family L-fucose permease-like MFS transporter n=1 Tax=Granulicella arctica TaxID=940613 RepID=A0A7Y9PIY7_9BACT|nr:sugar MFS transporter [Granulicella arctica]NYF80716.1 FHS family L-fucose permease-like MFS transporter [Granulicella arctica]